MWGLREQCGIIGVFGVEKAPSIVAKGLLALQHRGQESAGMAVSEGGWIRHHKGLGLVSEVFNEKVVNCFNGNIACGHVRYSTSGETSLYNAQPIVIRYHGGYLALAHNGNITNAKELRTELEMDLAFFQTTSDSEVISALIARHDKGNIGDAIKVVMDRLVGAYSLIVMKKDQLIAVRDPLGFRPLVLGRKGQGWIVASESCALDAIGATIERDIMPGEIIILDHSGLKSLKYKENPVSRLCLFEYIYFARPDSIIDGHLVQKTRIDSGSILAEEHPVVADLVIPVPDSGLSAGIGFAMRSGIPLAEGIVKNRFLHRTFIEPDPEIREIEIDMKFAVLSEVVRDKSVVIVDDSIVRGSTVLTLVPKLRKAGAKNIHIRIASPPMVWPCFFGIDTPTRSELIGAFDGIKRLERLVDADSLEYLSIDGINKVVPGTHCDACFTGNYPLDVGSLLDIESGEVKHI